MDTKVEVVEKEIHWVFEVSVVLKGVNAVLEIILGTLLLFTGEALKIVATLTANELIEDPNDFLATHIQNNLLPYLGGHAQLFGAFYLLSHGIIKIFLVWGLLRNKLWAYPASIVFLILFIIYQGVRYTHTHSIFLILLTLFDIFVLWLIWHEYRYLKGKIK